MNKCFNFFVPFRLDDVLARYQNWTLSLSSCSRALLLFLFLSMLISIEACAPGPKAEPTVPTGEPVQSGGITTQTVPTGELTVTSGEKPLKTGETQQQVAQGERTVSKEKNSSTKTTESASGNEMQMRKSDQTVLITLTGHVIDTKGNPLPGVIIEAQPLEPGLSRQTAITDASGWFRLSLPAGKYKITALISGFSEAVREITLQPGSAMNLEIELDIVPIGEPQPQPPPPAPDEQTSDSSVLLLTFANDTDLHGWLNKQASQQKIVLSIIPLGDQTSLFIVREGTGISYTVVPANGALCKEKLQDYINLNKDKSLVGVHLLGNRFLIIFRNGK